MRSRVSGLDTHRLAASSADGEVGDSCRGCGNCSDARAHCASAWSGSLQSLQSFFISGAKGHYCGRVQTRIEFIPRVRGHQGCLLLAKPFVILQPASSPMALTEH